MDKNFAAFSVLSESLEQYRKDLAALEVLEELQRWRNKFDRLSTTERGTQLFLCKRVHTAEAGLRNASYYH